MPTVDNHDFPYYLKCLIGGAITCGSTHTLMTPLDVMKCKEQIEPQYSKGFVKGIKKLRNNGHVFLGWTPTLVGYSLQGLGKFGFYQIFKDVYKETVRTEKAAHYKKIGWSVAAGLAEIIADVMLCPWEAIKLKMQLSRPGHEYPNSLKKTLRKVKAEQGKSDSKIGINSLYKGIGPLWSRQVPYTIVKFVSFESIVQLFYDHIFTEGKHNYSKYTQLSVTFVSGYLAGILCALVSHPADTVLSKLYSKGNQEGSIGQKISKIYKQIGFKGLWAGLLTRCIIIGTLTGMQWWIYDTFKTLVGLKTTGGE